MSKRGDITVKFTALQNSKVSKPHDDALDDALEDRVFAILKENPKAKQMDLINELNLSRATVQRTMKVLVEKGKIKRKGGKRYGYWEIHG